MYCESLVFYMYSNVEQKAIPFFKRNNERNLFEETLIHDNQVIYLEKNIYYKKTKETIWDELEIALKDYLDFLKNIKKENQTLTSNLLSNINKFDSKTSLILNRDEIKKIYDDLISVKSKFNNDTFNNFLLMIELSLKSNGIIKIDYFK